MQNHIRNTNLRFNLDKDQQRRAWEYLQTMDRQNFKSYSQVISLALVDYFDRYYRTQADPYLETRERVTDGVEIWNASATFDKVPVSAKAINCSSSFRSNILSPRIF